MTPPEPPITETFAVQVLATMTDHLQADLDRRDRTIDRLLEDAEGYLSCNQELHARLTRAFREIAELRVELAEERAR